MAQKPRIKRPVTPFALKVREYVDRRNKYQYGAAVDCGYSASAFSRKIGKNEPIDRTLMLRLTVYFRLDLEEAKEFWRLGGYDISAPMEFFDDLKELIALRDRPYREKKKILKKYRAEINSLDDSN